MRRWSLLGGWLLALLVTTVLTWQIVSAADDRVSERPVTPLNVDAPVLAVLDPTSTIPPTPPPDQTTTTLPGSSSTIPSGTTTTVRTATPATSPPTTVGWKVKTVPTKGGTVVVKYRSGEVVLQTATPAPGFSAEVEDAGPPAVDVTFESEDLTVEIDIEHAEGELEVDVSESAPES